MPTASGLRDTGWGGAAEVTDQALGLCPSSTNNTWSSKICLSYKSLHKGPVNWKHGGDAFDLSQLAPHRPHLFQAHMYEHIGRNHPRPCGLSFTSTGLEAPICGYPILSTRAIKQCLRPHPNQEEPVLCTRLEVHFKTQYNEFSLSHTIDSSLLNMCCSDSRQCC